MHKNVVLPILLILLASCGSPNWLHADADPTAILARGAGTWSGTYEMTVPFAATFTGESTAQWILDKKFLETRSTMSNGDQQLSLVNYNKETGKYFFWQFKSDGSFPLGATTGTWNEAQQEMTLAGEYPGGFRLEGSYTYASADRFDMEMAIRGPDGKVVFQMTGSSTRK